MIQIDSQTVVVFDAAELAMAVDSNNGISTVYLGADIALTEGIAIYPGKPALIIDGVSPLDGAGTIHSITDLDGSSLQTATLGVRTASSIQITMRNLTLIGRNFFGIPSIIELAGTSGVSITYQNVMYTGPQMVFNVYGLTRIIDSVLTIVPGFSPIQEAGEVNRLELGGTVTIRHNGAGIYSTFWFRGTAANGYFRVLADADVDIATTNYFMFCAFSVPYTIERGASFTLDTRRGISYDPAHHVSTFTVEEDAAFIYTQQEAFAATATMYLNGGLTVRPGAVFHMTADFVTTAPLIRFDAAGEFLTVDNPASFVLYSRGVAALSFLLPTQLSLSGGQLNYWATATAFPAAGTFADTPLYKWNRPDYSPFLLTGTVGAATTTISANSFTPGELAALPPLSNFQLQNARVVSIGVLPVALDPILEDGAPITGLTEPYANVRIQYDIGGQPRLLTGTADEAGMFSLPVPEPIPAGTPVTVSVNTPFLITTILVEASETGELGILQAPMRIVFAMLPVSNTPLLLARADPEEPVLVSDTRVFSEPWTLYAAIEGPMQTEDGHVLPDAVVYVADAPADYIPLTITPLPVYQGGPGVPLTEVAWPVDRGILLHVTQPLINGEVYSALLQWRVE